MVTMTLRCATCTVEERVPADAPSGWVQLRALGVGDVCCCCIDCAILWLMRRRTQEE